jgi:hypothetical protein
MPNECSNHPQTRKLRILIIAELCHPEWSSVPLLAERCRRMSLSSVNRVRCNFTWPQKAAQIVTIYRDLLGLPHDATRSFSLDGQGAVFSFPMESPEWAIASHQGFDWGSNGGREVDL